MLTSSNRFHGHGSLKYLYKNGRTVRSRSFMIRFINNPMRAHSRVVVVVAKKVMKSAVGRNRIRRRVYEVIRHELTHLPPHIDIAVSVFSADVALMPAQELERELSGLLELVKHYQTGAKTAKLE